MSYCLLCVIDATGIVLCCCCTAVPLSQAAERATLRTHLVLLSSFAYDMCHAHCCCCCCCLYCCVFRANDTLSFPTANISIPYHTLITHQVPGITKNRSYNHNGRKYHTSLTAQRQQQHSSIAILARSREGNSSTCTTHTVFCGAMFFAAFCYPYHRSSNMGCKRHARAITM